MSVNVEVPYKFTPRDYQLPLLQAMDNPKYNRAIAVWHRRAGKDKTTINLMVKKMCERVGTYYYFFPTYQQGKKILWDGIGKDGFKMLDHFPKELVVKANETEMKIKLKNGSVFQIIGTDKIDTIVGTNPVGCIFSEYSIQNPDAWNFIRPILAENEGWAVFVYTPRGMNHGWDLLKQAEKSDKWFVQTLTVHDTNAIKQEMLDDERKTMPQSLYQQEFECKFLDSATQVFRRVDDNLWSGDLIPEQGNTYKVGADLAKHEDYTVITPFCMNTWRVGRQESFNQMDWNLQKARIEATVLRFNKATLTLDATGIGDPIYDDLVNRDLYVEPFKFTQSSREALLNNLAILLEQDQIKIPDDEELIHELKSFRYETLPSGKIKMMVPSNVHDDRVMSLALAVWNIGGKIPKPNATYSEDDFNLYNYNY